MIQRNHLNPPIQSAILVKLMLLGAAIAFVWISFLVFPIQHPAPEWGKLWMVRPLMVVPLAGATGGFIAYFLYRWGSNGGWRKALAITLGALIYVFGIWMGTVLGLVGTLWN